jgi:ATP-dependent Lhr-like helicase
LHIDERAGAFVQVALEHYGLLTTEIVSRFESRWTWAHEAPAVPSVRDLWEGHHNQPELHGPREVTWSWGELSEQLGRMELRGEVRRGYFVSGLSGVQYALPQAVEILREARDGLDRSSEVTLLSSLDPVNLYGGELGVSAAEAVPHRGEGEIAEGQGADGNEGTPKAAPSFGSSFRFARVASTHIVLYRGMPVLVAEDNGTRLRAAEEGDETLREALKTYLNRPTAPRRSVLNTWNEGPVIGSRGESLLRELGATRSPTGLDYWRG